MEDKKFIFNNNFDSSFLFSLYEEDFPYIAEIFQQTLSGLATDLVAVKNCYDNQDVASLRKAIHKIKPAFGFAGLTSLQDACQQFENLCASEQDTRFIGPAYEALMKAIREGLELLKMEHHRLTEFNAPIG